MDPMDWAGYQESIRKDFKDLEEMFKKNFYRLSAEKLEKLRIKISDLKDLLRTKEKPKY